MIEKIDISNPSIAEEIRKQMASVSPNQNGLMPSSGFIARPAIGRGANFNDYTSSGIHMISDNYNDTTNGPGFNYGVLCVFKPGAYVFQIAVSVTGDVAKFRTRTEAAAGWRAWTNL